MATRSRKAGIIGVMKGYNAKGYRSALRGPNDTRVRGGYAWMALQSLASRMCLYTGDALELGRLNLDFSFQVKPVHRLPKEGSAVRI